MFWKLVQLLFGLAIIVPILGAVYYHFTNTTNGTFVNSATVNSTALGVTQAELAYWTVLPILLAIMILIFIGALLAGVFKNNNIMGGQ